MRSRFLALVLVLVVTVSSLAIPSLGMAADLGSSSVATTSSISSSDVDFLFSNDQVAAVVIPDEELQATQGQALVQDLVNALTIGLLGVTLGQLLVFLGTVLTAAGF